MRSLFRSRLILIFAAFAGALLISSCNGSSTGPDNSDLEWNKQIAVAYVHSYAVSIGEAVLEMNNDATKIAYIRRAIDPIVFYQDSSGYFVSLNWN